MATDAEVSSVVKQIGGVVRSGQCILFLGAGVHAPPPKDSRFVYPVEQRPPLGSALSEQLASSVGARLGVELPNEDPRNLQRVALFYEMERSRHKLVEEIRTSVQVGKRPSPALRALGELDFPLIITTNYDQLLEQAFVLAGKQPRVSVYTPNLEGHRRFSRPVAAEPGRLQGPRRRRSS